MISMRMLSLFSSQHTRLSALSQIAFIPHSFPPLPSSFFTIALPSCHLLHHPHSSYAANARFRVLSSSARAMSAVKDRIELSELERAIFAKMLGAVGHFNLKTQLRVAGGWVRDKLLGKECYDIDVALDNMLGREFCEKLNDYLQSIGEETKNVAVIMSNPDQSKHLETARMRVNGIWIDFVNLRAETYADNSRIPKMEFGTAEQDAYRRDLTINSLFYNINTGTVEDFTKRGLSDLRNGTICTPLPPKCTFLDDPLRVLRAVRFGARFNFSLDEELKKAAATKEVIEALCNKVSPERIGHEIELMLTGFRPVDAMHLLVELDLFSTVFKPPKDLAENLPDGWPRSCAGCMEMVVDTLEFYGPEKLSTEQKKLCFLAALFWPLRDVTVRQKKSKQIPLSSNIIREALKLKVSDGDAVVALHNTSREFIRFRESLQERNDAAIKCKRELEFNGSLQSSHEADNRVQLGLLLMNIKELWRAALVISSILQDSANHTWISAEQSILQRASQHCIQLENFVLQLGLEKVWELKPLLDGEVIMRVLGLKNGGPQIKDWKDRAFKWQLAHPMATLEQCLDWFEEERSKRIKMH